MVWTIRIGEVSRRRPVNITEAERLVYIELDIHEQAALIS